MPVARRPNRRPHAQLAEMPVTKIDNSSAADATKQASMTKPRRVIAAPRR